MTTNYIEKHVPKTLMVVGDLHYGITDRRVEAARIAFLRDMKPEMYVDLGDHFDFWSVSTYPKDPARLALLESKLQFEFDQAQPHNRAVCDVAGSYHLIEGNHDERRSRTQKREPGLHGLRALELERMAELPEKIRVHPCGTRLHIGPLTIEHGHAVPRGVVNPAQWMIRNRRRNVISGHVHYQSQASVTTYDERGKPEVRQAWTQGCGINFAAQDYQSDPNWQHGFTWVEFYRPSGSSNAPWRFNVYPILIIEGKFSFGGRVYDGKKWQ